MTPAEAAKLSSDELEGYRLSLKAGLDESERKAAANLASVQELESLRQDRQRSREVALNELQDAGRQERLESQRTALVKHKEQANTALAAELRKLCDRDAARDEQLEQAISVGSGRAAELQAEADARVQQAAVAEARRQESLRLRFEQFGEAETRSMTRGLSSSSLGLPTSP